MTPIEHSELAGLMLSAPEIIPLDTISGLRGDLTFARRHLAMRVDTVDLARHIAVIDIPEMGRTQRVAFTSDADLMTHTVWYPEERLRTLIAAAARVVSGRGIISDEAAERMRNVLGEEEAA